MILKSFVDKKKWHKIVHSNSDAIWQTAYRLTGNEADAADCLQDTFVNALVLSKKQKVRHWPGLLKRIATSRALDCLRKRYRHNENFCSLSGQEALATARVDGPMEIALTAELGVQLARALSLIPEKQSQVFCLRHLEAMSYKHIAVELEIKVGTVSMLLHRAKESLSKILKHEHIEEGCHE